MITAIKPAITRHVSGITMDASTYMLPDRCASLRLKLAFAETAECFIDKIRYFRLKDKAYGHGYGYQDGYLHHFHTPFVPYDTEQL